MKPTRFSGHLWLIVDENGKLIDDIDTDMIYHNAHLAITDIDKMGQFTFGNLQGWEDFSKKASAGDIVVCGKNFGSGSSRQHAVDCFKSLKIAAVIADSFGAIYKRNAINAGFPILTCPEIDKSLDELKQLLPSDRVELDLVQNSIRNLKTQNILINTEPFGKVQMDIYQAGNIFEYGRTH